jgi:hypothetical protein
MKLNGIPPPIMFMLMFIGGIGIGSLPIGIIGIEFIAIGIIGLNPGIGMPPRPIELIPIGFIPSGGMLIGNGMLKGAIPPRGGIGIDTREDDGIVSLENVSALAGTSAG